MSRAQAVWLIVTLQAAVAGCAPGERLNLARDETSTERGLGYSARDAEVIETGRDGQPRYRLRASRIEQDPLSLDIRIEQPVMRFETAGGTGWQVSAKQGRLPAGAERLRLDGEVTLQGTTIPGKSPIRLRTDQLDYDLLGERAVARGAVTMDIEGHLLEARGLEADLRNQRARLLSDIHGHFSP